MIRIHPLDLRLAAGLFALAFALRLIAFAGTGFDGLYGQDAYAYLDYAERLPGALAAGDLPPFFWPLGYPALLMLPAGLFGAGGAQAITIMLGAALAPLGFAIARQIGVRRWAALLAGAIPACGGQAIQSSIVLMADIPALFWAMLSAAALIVTARRRSVRAGWPLLLGASLALAIVTRWLYLALILPWAAALLLSRARLRTFSLALAAALLILLPQIAHSLSSPYPTLDHPWVTGWSPAHWLQSTFENVDGHFSYAQINALYYAQPLYAPIYLSPWLALLIVPGLWRLRMTPRVLTLLGGWLIVPYAFLAGIPYQNIRFPLIVLPALAVMCAAGLDALLRWPRMIGRVVVLAAVALALAQMVGEGQAYASAFVARHMDERGLIAWAAERLPDGATIYALGLALPLRRYTDLTPIELYEQTPVSLSAARDGQTAYLLINPWQIERQWAGRSPQIAVAWLRDQRGLHLLAERGYYRLYEVSP